MARSRKDTTAKILEYMTMFAGKNDYIDDLESMLNGLTNAQFEKYIADLGNGSQTLRYVQPNFDKNKITLKNNIAISKKIGHNFFERLWLTDNRTGETQLTPMTYLVVDLPFRRQQQHLMEKISIPKHNRSIDELTGQVAPPSKGSALSFPEAQVLYSHGLEQTLRELYKFRGGDEEAYRKLARDASVSGLPSMDAVDDGTTRPTSTITLSNFFRGMHLDNNL